MDKNGPKGHKVIDKVSQFLYDMSIDKGKIPKHERNQGNGKVKGNEG